MPKGFQRIKYAVGGHGDEELRTLGVRAITRRGAGFVAGDTAPPEFNSEEAAARFYLGRVLDQDERPAMRGLATPERPQHAPDMRLVGVDHVPQSPDGHRGERLVRFAQTASSIPVFGSRVVVHLDHNRELLGVLGDVADVRGVSPIAALAPLEAARKIGKHSGLTEGDLAGLQPPELTFFHQPDAGAWHLAYHFKEVPAAGAVDATSPGQHGLAPSPRDHRVSINWLVDAHDGEILFQYSAAPTAVEVPSQCWGHDVAGTRQIFHGRKVGGTFELADPMRHITTYDLAAGDIDSAAMPATPVRHTAADFADANRGAVSAHVHATHVHDFYKTVLQRDGIDDKKMELISIVNCTYVRGDQPPVWRNAVWWKSKMWYGQDQDGGGTLRSYARFLDVIAHEMTHGITEHTAALVYQGQSGALNESFSDIFGVMIANWKPHGPDLDAGSWTWTIGAGLGPGGRPLRDLQNPGVTGDPDHMAQFVHTTADWGGVHTNSNIHNKAAYNVLTATGAGGQRVLTPAEAAILFYLALGRLSSQAVFDDVLTGLLEVAEIYYAGDPGRSSAVAAALRDSYERVGIGVAAAPAPAPAPPAGT